MEPRHGDQQPHVPPPSLWPVGFAVGIVCILVGLIVSWPAVAAGAVITAVFGFLWVRDVTTEQRRSAVEAAETTGPESATAGVPARPAHEGEAALPPMDEDEIDRFPRAKFLEGATLGLGAVIGGLVSVPALGFMVLPAFVDQAQSNVDVGPLTNFPEGEWRVVTFLREPGQPVSRRTAFVRNNGALAGKPSFTAISNHCAHLGCPVQPGGPTDTKKQVTIGGAGGPKEVDIIPTKPSNFGCPCHGGSYDIEGNRIAGPPVRALDRYEFLIKDGHLVLGKTYSVAKVQGTGKNALIKRYTQSYPGVHVDGIESWLYPIHPPGA